MAARWGLTIRLSVVAKALTVTRGNRQHRVLLRIGQKHSARVIFFGYIGSSQITCLYLMTKKIGAGFGCVQGVSREQPNKNFSLDKKNGSLFRDPFFNVSQS
nr:hypothetical protein [Pseudomonas brassicacearum]